jgi:hypothetical protein
MAAILHIAEKDGMRVRGRGEPMAESVARLEMRR